MTQKRKSNRGVYIKNLQYLCGKKEKYKMDKTLKDFRLFAKDKGVSGMLFDDYTSKMPYDSYIEPKVLEERKNMNLQLVQLR